MIKGIYSSSNGLPPMLVRMEVISNNLANIDTPGFKKDSLFVEMMNDSGIAPNPGSGELTDRLNTIRTIDFSEGSHTQTNGPLDVALQGEGYFVLQTPQGERYTRNGGFTLALDGTLTTKEGYPVLGEDGKIQFPDLQKMAHGEILISQSGDVSLDKNVLGKLRVVEFGNETALCKTGNAMFMVDKSAEADIKEKAHPVVRQGFVEESNVDGIEEMIEMIEIQRNFESNQKAIASQDATLDRTLEVGKF
jgi:flagellar basal-body rod protein FlgF